MADSIYDALDNSTGAPSGAEEPRPTTGVRRPTLGERFSANRADGFYRGTLAGSAGLAAGTVAGRDAELMERSRQEAEAYNDTSPEPREGETPLQARMRSEPTRPLGWLQKPYTMVQLVRSVKQALSDLADLR